MPRKKKHKAPIWAVERGQQDNDTFSPIFNSLLKSEAFRNLHTSAQIVLIFCHNQATDRTANKCLYAHTKTHPYVNPNGTKAELQTYGEYFVFPAKHADLYGMQRQNVKRALDELEAAGFIEVFEDNQHRHLVNVYKFSPEWHNWSKSWFEERKRRIEERKRKRGKCNKESEDEE